MKKYEQLAIQTNDNDKSSTLAQIHIQACTKVKIDPDVARAALLDSFNAKHIVQISERGCGKSYNKLLYTICSVFSVLVLVESARQGYI